MLSNAGFLIVAAVFISMKCFAASVESETTFGSYSTEQMFSVDGDLASPGIKKKKLTEHIPFAIDFAQTNTKSTDTDGNQVNDITRAFTGNLGYESIRHFEGGVGYAYSNTPNENLSTLGPNISFGYALESDSEDFKRTIGIKVTASSTRYVETFESTQPPLTKRGKPKPISGENEIIQSSFQVEVPIKPYEWVTFRPSATFYHYNTDVDTFLDDLNSKRLALSTIGLQNSAVSLASFEAAVQAKFNITDSWDLLLSEDYAILAVDKSNSWAAKVEVFYDLDDWTFGLGYSNLRSTPANDDALIINVSYDF